MIAQETIERVREQTSLVELIGESVRLERRGRSHVGLCPFHKEKSPSFHVNDERGFYHCFGCKASGDALKFVQQTEGLEFIEAVRRLAERLGIEVVDDLSEAERRQRAEAKRREQSLYDLGASAASYFERMLMEHPHRGFALGELERRGLAYGGPATDTLKAFRVGYAPDGWEGLVQHLRRAGLDLDAAGRVGLVAPRRQGPGHYDRFRHRLMFAVLDLQGRVVAFSGRALEAVSPEDQGDDAPAKYINSPESPIYKKREVVFGLYQARGVLRSGAPAVVVEGNFDVVSLHARGVQGAVAPLGTAFTVEQARLLKRFTSGVTFMFDADKAGRKAVAASRQPCREVGLSARVASLPEGMDPDDFSRTKGSDALLGVVRAARGMLEHLIDEVLDEGFNLGDAHSRADKLRQVTELLSSEDDPAVRALAEQHADYLAARLGVADARTFRALKSAVQRSLAPRDEDRPKPQRDLAPPARARSRGKREDIALCIVGALLDFPELLDMSELLSYADVMEGDLALSVIGLRHALDQASSERAVGGAPVDLRAALAKMPPSIRPFAIARVAAPRHQKVDEARAELIANMNKLRRLEEARLASSALNELERARRTGDFDQELELLREQASRAKKRHGL